MKRYSIFTKDFGEKAKSLREERGLTQEGLAHLAKVTQAQVSRLESGLGGTTLITIIKVAVALGYQPKFLFDVQIQLPLNENFQDQRQRRPVIPILMTFIESGGLEEPMKVGQIISQIFIDLGVNLKSSSTSRALEDLVRRKIISKEPAEKGRVFLYRKIR